MMTVGAIGFTAPALLLGLIALPVLWIILRAIPPAPIRRRFPAVALMLGLMDDETQAARTPWWLLLLRTLAIAAAIIGFAGPVLNPNTDAPPARPLMVLLDGTWSDARTWSARLDRALTEIDEASRAGQTVTVVQLTDIPTEAPLFQSAEAWGPRVAGLSPKAWEPAAETLIEFADILPARAFDTVWLSDGLDRDGRDALSDALQARGDLRVVESPRAPVGLRPVTYADGALELGVVRAPGGAATEVQIDAIGLDPAGVERTLATAPIALAGGETEAGTELRLPPELRNRITRFEINGIASAGAVVLADDALRRREVALIAGRDDREGLQLLSPLHYLEQALIPTADLIDGAIEDILRANPDVIVLADVARLTGNEASGIEEWVQEGGLLVRFAGPRLASSDVSRETEDPLLPVRLRAGGRTVGGAMSWGQPKELSPFPEESPFHGLSIPADVRISAQVMAQPDPTLAERSIAMLSDGTPLVTRKRSGNGQIVLFHVTANAEWSTLPLSGLFVQMLERLSVSTRPARPSSEDLAGTIWVADEVLDGFGALQDAGTLEGVPGERLADARPGPDMPPGLYAGRDQRIAVNVISPDRVLERSVWPANVAVDGLTVVAETLLKGPLLTLALAFLLLDILATLWLGGRLLGPRAQVAVFMTAVLALPPSGAEAQTDDAFAQLVTGEVVLAHVLTGDPDLDQLAADGLTGLGRVLTRRTAIEPIDPIGVDLETDELSFFPFLYWPVSTSQPIPSDVAYTKLNRYLRTGGLILFDTRDSQSSVFGARSDTGQMLRQLAAPLDIPPLEPIPADHVLTRTFYLLQDFPGRYRSREIWVEAAPADATQVEGMPFRNLNDGVTPVVIGGNDWAGAWAVDATGLPRLPVGRGFAGERQRELAFRFGVNLIMHVLTGNYKSDQVHVPALLDRLGQ